MGVQRENCDGPTDLDSGPRRVRRRTRRGDVQLSVQAAADARDRNMPKVIWRVDLQEQPRDAVAKDLGITLNNITVRLHRGRQALKTRLEQMLDSARFMVFFDCDWHAAEKARARFQAMKDVRRSENDGLSPDVLALSHRRVCNSRIAFYCPPARTRRSVFQGFRLRTPVHRGHRVGRPLRCNEPCRLSSVLSESGGRLWPADEKQERSKRSCPIAKPLPTNALNKKVAGLKPDVSYRDGRPCVAARQIAATPLFKTDASPFTIHAAKLGVSSCGDPRLPSV